MPHEVSRPRHLAVLVLVTSTVVLSGCTTPPLGAAPGPTSPGTPTAYDVSGGHVVRTGAQDYLNAVRLNAGGTGVLVGRHSVLSAAHANTPVGSIVQVTSDARAGYYWQAEVTAVARMPGYVAGSLDLGDVGATDPDDLAILRLADDLPAALDVDGTVVKVEPAPVEFDVAPVQGCAACVRHVGFGATSGEEAGDSAYTKRSITTGIDEVSSTKFEYGQVVDGTYVGTCHGYSGGPGYAWSGGVEKVVGIVNGGDEACRTNAWDIKMNRADVKSFVQQTILGWDDCTGNLNCATQTTGRRSVEGRAEGTVRPARARP